MVKHYFTYITKEGDYELLKVVLAKAFSTEFVDHESGWWGEYALSKNGSEIKLYPNFVSGEGYHHEGKPSFPYLFEITEQKAPKELLSSCTSYQSNLSCLNTTKYSKAIKQRTQNSRLVLLRCLV